MHGFGNHILLGLAVLAMAVSTPSGQPAPLQPGEVVLAKTSLDVTWSMKRVAPPSPLYVTPDDLLVCGAASSQTNELVTVNYRLLRAFDSRIVAGQFTVAPANTRAVKVQTQNLTEGFLLSVSVKAAIAVTRGQTFARLFLGSGPYGAGEPSYMLMADYVTTAMAPAFPNGRQLAPTEGPGLLTRYSVSVGAGLDWTVSVPSNARWRIMGASATLATSAAVASRTPSIGLSVDNTAPMLISGFRTLTASQAGAFEWTLGGAAFTDAAGNTVVGMGGPFEMLHFGGGGGFVQSSTQNLQAADQWSFINVHVEEWLDNV